MKVVFISVDPQTVLQVRLALHLQQPDTTLLCATMAAAGLELVEQESPDVVLLHADSPGMSLPSIIHGVRSFSKVPLLVLGRGEEGEARGYLDLGADDYLRVPGNITELVARIWALRRRDRGAEGESGRYRQ